MTARGRASGPEALWQSLLGAAILGADRGAGLADAAVGGASYLLAQAARQDPAEAMLAQAAILSVYGRAGRRIAGESAQLPEPAPADPQPACSARAGRQLAAILFEDFHDLLPEWCRLADMAGRRAPDELLPALLRRTASARPDEAAAIRSILGERGRWLAAQEPRWSTALAGGGEEGAWDGGDIEDRIAALTAIRRADPQRARTMLAESWEGEAADDRSKLLPILEDGLSQADEDFLESALNDRKAGVREAAAALLALLPDSRYAARMASRLRDLVKLSQKRGLMGTKTVLEVVLPEQPDKEMKRDGLSDRQQDGLGKKASLLLSLIAAAPLAIWAEAKPEDWLAAAVKSDWRDALLWGWARAAARQRNEAWASALLDTLLGLVRSPKLLDQHKTALADAMAAVIPARREAAVRGRLTDTDLHLAGQLLASCTHDWSRDFSAAVLAWLKKRFPEKNHDGWHLREPMKRDFGRHMDPVLAAEAGSGWRRDRDGWTASLEETIDRFTRMLEFRADMQKEMKP